MGFLSSLFDFGDKPTTKTSNIVPQYPEELKPNIQEIVDASKTIYDQRLGEGYQPYTGQTIAGFTPEEVASQEGLKSLVGTQGPLQQEALDIARGTDRQFTPEAAQQYMSPYLRTALDAQKAESQRQYERSQRPQFEADAVAAGGMSGLGTRAAVESAEREVGQQRLLANIEAAGQQKAFESAQKAFQDQTSRERQAAAQISTAAPNIFKSGIAEQGLLQTMGEQKRDLAQSTLDEAYLKYVEQQQFPEQQLARYQSSIYGNPLLKQPSYNTTGTTTGGGPGLGKTLLGLGTTALGFGTGGGSSIGGSLLGKIMSAGGGGIGSTMKAQEYMNRNMGGQVMPPIVYQQEGSFKDRLIDMLPGGLSDYIRYGTDDGEASDIAYGTVPLENAKPTRKSQFSPFQKDQPETKERPSIEPTFNSLNLGEGKTLQKIKDAGSLEKYIENQEKFNKLNAKIGKITPPVQSDKPETGKITPPVQSDKPKTAKKKKDVKPVKVDTSRKYPDNPDLADNEPGSDKESLNAMYKARLAKAGNVEKKTMVTIAQKVQEQSGSDGITTIRKAFETYNKDVRAFIDKDPYRRQKFWATIGAAIMQPGNAFANMAKGFKQAIDGLDASDKKKNELLMALTGKRFDTEVAVGGIQEKRGSSLKDRINKLNIAIAGAKGKELAALLKARATLLKGERTNQSKINLQLLKSEDSDLYDMVKGRIGKFNKAQRKRFIKKIEDFGGGTDSWIPNSDNKDKVAAYFKSRLAQNKDVGKIFNEILK